MRIKFFFLIILISGLLTNCNNKKDIMVIAHRGGSNLAPENTLAAFQNAIDLGVDMIEIDIEQTGDSVVVVIHDTKIDRTTPGTGAVDSLTYNQIKDLDAGSWFDQKYSSEKIPTLDQVFELLDGQVILLIEIKSGGERYPGIERRTVEAIRKYNASSWVIVQSFNEKAVLRIKEMDSAIETYFLLGGSTFNDYYNNNFASNKNLQTGSFRYDGLAIHHSVLNAQVIEAIQKSGMGVFTWTVNEPKEMDQMIKSGIDGIITDSPDILINKLKGNTP